LFIPPLSCPQCGTTGRPGEEHLQCDNIAVYCRCGYTIPESSTDRRILSTNSFVRLGTGSNYVEHGSLSLSPGHAKWVEFKRPIDFVAKVYLNSNGVAYAQESKVTPKGMLVLTTIFDGFSLSEDRDVQVTWIVYGLIDLETLPNWYLQFYAAMTQLINETAAEQAHQAVYQAIRWIESVES
jgi:hypothetical protein